MYAIAFVVFIVTLAYAAPYICEWLENGGIAEYDDDNNTF